MATWRDYDALETAIARVGGDILDVIERLDKINGNALAPSRHAQVMDRAKDLKDAMRQAKRVAEAVVVAEKGYRI